MDKQSNLSLVPTKVRIIKAGRPNWWYADKIGQVFNVRLGTGVSDHILWDDYWNRAEVMRHIDKQDCVIVKPSATE